jgi:NADH-quinone oxidoreductase subunit M
MTAVALNGLVALPAGFVLLTMWAGRRRDRAGIAVAVVGAALTLAWSVWAATAVSSGLDGNHVDHAWVEALDIRWHLGMDGISGPLVLMTTLVFALGLLSLLRRPPAGGSATSLAALLLLIEAGVLGSFLALDLVLFFAFFEVALIPMWFVIHQWGDPHDEPGRHRAANRFLVFTVLGSALMLVGFVVVRAETGTFDIVRIAYSYAPSGSSAVIAAVLVGLGLAIKTPVWPLHIWLPDAHASAPTVGSVVLAAVLLKLGTYGLVRFWLPIVDPRWDLLAPFAAGLATVGIVYAALACLAQTDLKRLIAYSSVGHMGFVVLALATFTTGGIQAAVFASVAHGLITGLLFFLAGAVKERFGTADLALLQGLYRQVPHTAGIFAFAAMASLGLPGLAGFWGEVLAVRAALFPAAVLPRGTFVVLAVVAAFGVILTSAYFLALMRTLLQGEPTPAAAAATAPAARGVVEPGTPAGATGAPDTATGEAPAAEETSRVASLDASPLDWVVWGPLVVLTVVLGVVPGLVLSPVGEAATAFLRGL